MSTFFSYPKYFATTNINKLQEISDILGFPLEQIALDLFEPQGLDVAEVVAIKAKDAYERTGKAVLVEDTGLTFIAWNGLPGALIKWFLDTVGTEGMLRMLVGDTDRRAIARTAIGFYDGTQLHIFIGELRGQIPTAIRGNGDFGWGPLFIPDGHTHSFAEMSKEEKNAISMRKIAVEKMRSALS
jgi:XTP/dITP diphosphohydrolase